MNNFLEDFLIEIALFSFLGVIYYFYQKRRIVNYEENKSPIVMEFILQSCLSEKNDIPEAELDSLIEALDDYLQNQSSHPPVALLKHFMTSALCSEELRNIIREGLIELELHDDKK
jgi:hypothetical protein